MLDINDFAMKQIIVFEPVKGDKMSFKNDNILITTKEGETKYQHTCHRIFMVIVIGDTTITTGLIRRAKKFGFSICLMTMGLKVYSIMDSKMEGNTFLHRKQYVYDKNDIAKRLIYNKIANQCNALKKIRNKTPDIREGIEYLNEYLRRLGTETFEGSNLLALEGNAARIYFARIFNITKWKGRKPRIKFDYVNSLLDIGYTILFNFLDAILQVFGFDTYQGVLHTNFYMRKSLVCDLMEPFRVIIDWKVRKGIKLGQFKESDFVQVGGQWQLEYKKSSQYTGVLMEELLEYKEEIFLYIRSYYRCFMKEKEITEYPLYVYK